MKMPALPALVVLFLAGLLAGRDSAFAQTWTLTKAPTNYWQAVTSSADGTKIVAAVNRGPIYTSTDSGVSWNVVVATNQIWQGVACSADGSNLVAVASGSPIYTSTNSGVSWAASNSPSHSWSAVASSADGSKLAAAAEDGPIYTSTDSGGNWAPLTNAPSKVWVSVASSADGNTLLAVPSSGPIYTSVDSGATWTITNSPSAAWSSVASSADGGKRVAVAVNGAIYRFANSGTNWLRVSVTNAPAKLWISLASSADGATLAALPSQGPLYLSRNSGVNWTTSNIPSEIWTVLAPPTSPGTNVIASSGVASWSAAALSADGNKLVALANAVAFAEASGGATAGTLVTNTVRLPGSIFTLEFNPAPALAIQASANAGILSWSSSAAGFLLQESPDWRTTNWTALTIKPVTTNGQNQVIVPPLATQRFYRLKKP